MMKMTTCFVFCISLIFISTASAEIIFEDDFMGDNVEGFDALNWQWWIDLNSFATEADDVPEFGPGVLALGGDAGGTSHIGLEIDEIKALTDYQITVLWTDRLIDGETDDGDFHIGVRCQEYDAETEFPASCYEVEIDGDDNDSANTVPEDGPTSFHLFIRGGAAAVDNDGNALAHATRDVVPRPVANEWYWTTIEIQGFKFRAKHWRHGTEESDWILEAEDLDQQFPQGGVRLGVWSGAVHVAYVKIETVEAAVPAWSIYE
ncbi:MAG: hypothetical protein P9L94_04660 [Candidatus Hinthialibacter antarcticus]|nr:hypothetical protein [Candidatus Hinthialibacter antarcticus]